MREMQTGLGGIVHISERDESNKRGKKKRVRALKQGETKYMGINQSIDDLSWWYKLKKKGHGITLRLVRTENPIRGWRY